MRNMLLIARREYLEQIRGRAFRISTVGARADSAAAGRQRLYRPQDGRRQAHRDRLPIALCLPTRFATKLLDDKERSYTVDVVAPATREDRADLLRAVQNKAIDGVLWIETSASGSAHGDLYLAIVRRPDGSPHACESALNRGLVKSA